MKRAGAPFFLLLAYGLAFAWKALRGGLLVFDDHPGQLYRIAHVLTVGFEPWRLDPSWWAGYAELQFYPPGFSYAGAALHYASLGTLGLAATYQVLLWITFLLPGVSVDLLLARVLGSPWLALPGAFIALTLSAGSRSGVEEGLRWGLVAARLGWAALPLLALSLCRWTSGPRPPLAAPLLLAAIILIHPAHAPAGVVLVFLAAWHGPGSRPARLGQAALLSAAAGGLAAFWLLPLLVHLDMALPLAWGEPSLRALAGSAARQPLLLVLAGASALASWSLRRSSAPAPAELWLSDLAPALGLVILLDGAIAEPLGLLWLPADRLLDSLLLGLILGASLALSAVQRRVPALPSWTLAIASIAIGCLFSSPTRAEPGLSLWPRSGPNEWPKQTAVAEELHLGELWAALREAPAGRALFVRSGVPLEYRADWRRPHSHITALAPLDAGREILNGTFTHPSPVAGLVYTGSPVNRPITLRVEQRDGVTLFGRPLAELRAESFNDLAARLRVSAVVALEEDRERLGFIVHNREFSGPSRIGPFLLFLAKNARPMPAPLGPQRWQVAVPAHQEGWVATGMAYSPLWRCRADGRLLEARPDNFGLLQVKVPAGGSAVIELAHVPGAAERIGLTLSGVACLALFAVSLRRLAAR